MDKMFEYFTEISVKYWIYREELKRALKIDCKKSRISPMSFGSITRQKIGSKKQVGVNTKNLLLISKFFKILLINQPLIRHFSKKKKKWR